jgi:N-formylglutamate amidohydrolase
MPSSASGIGLRERDHRVDVVLGDNHGEACAPALIDYVERWMSAKGLRVRRNQPYAGGFTTQRYGRPGIGRHVLQIEINRSLYMDEAQHTKLAAFDALARVITGLLDAIGEQAAEALRSRPLAAE